MKTRHYLMIAGSLLLGLSAQSVIAAAGDHPAPPTEAQMQAVKTCAEAKGVMMPEPPKGKQGEKPTEGQRPDGPPPGRNLTDAQRAIINECFKEAGLETPKGPPHAGDHGDRKGPPPTPPT